MSERLHIVGEFAPGPLGEFEVHRLRDFTKAEIKKLPPALATVGARRAYALSLRAEVEALGGVNGADLDHIKKHPDMAIQFYQRVLATEYEINGRKPAGPN